MGGEREKTTGDMERDSDVSLEFAPRFREDLCLCQCLLIHHTSCGPGSDTLQRWIHAQLCHACVLTVPGLLLSLFSLSFSFSEWVSGLSALPRARWTDTVLQWFYTCSTSWLVLSLSTERLLPFPVLPASVSCSSLHTLKSLAVNSCYKSRISHDDDLGLHFLMIHVYVLIWQDVHLQPSVWVLEMGVGYFTWSILLIPPDAFARTAYKLSMKSDFIMNRLD